MAGRSCRNARVFGYPLISGYRENYKESDRLYRELLTADPDDEAASLGLVHNLTLEGKRAEARVATANRHLRDIPRVFSCSNIVIIYHQAC